MEEQTHTWKEAYLLLLDRQSLSSSGNHPGLKTVEGGKATRGEEGRCGEKAVPCTFNSLPMSYRHCWPRQAVIAVTASLGSYFQAGLQHSSKLTTDAF